MSWAQEDDDANPFSSGAPAAAPAPVPASNTAPPAPSWLSTPESAGGKDAPAPESTANTLRPPSPPNTQQQQQAPAPGQQEKRASAVQMNAVALEDMEKQQSKKEPPKAVVYLRFINLMVSILVCVLSVLCVITFNANVAKAIMSIYVFCFGFMICCFEMQFKAFLLNITDNFGFFFDAKMRTLFLLFVSLLCFDLGVLGIVMGTGLLFCAGLNAYALCKYPEFIIPAAVSEEQKKAATAKAMNAGTTAAIQGAQWHNQQEQKK